MRSDRLAVASLLTSASSTTVTDQRTGDDARGTVWINVSSRDRLAEMSIVDTKHVY